MRLSVFLPLAGALLLGACNRDTGADAGSATPADTTPPASATAPAGTDDKDVTMRYACDGNTSVAILGSDTARVDLPDGPDVTLSKVAGSAPPVFTGGELYFAIGDSGAHLSRGDETNELTCRPQ
ncbi:hypothetical protein MQC88_07240 [Luteimonas sp. 50]|uniref:C-type lysozyme inhibitor domain-containing protein n=1 Tax=Cognatiluteimonas sedimenti TaxID=2927791 RepID=A0ABT0A445_9GAMM|nr:hypothetical protein [Lysobacter sedimenti]MCJ0825749.1 hypothetical protein [Lysobacter sedimenti]